MPLEPYNSTRIRAVRLKPGKGRESLGRHPWILEASLVESVSPPRLGEQVDVLGADGRWIGRGLYHPESRIRVRMYVWSQDQWIDAERFAVRIGQAIELRRQYLAGSGQVDGLRWINSEGDFLSGLVVDGFAGHLVVQVNARVLMPYLDGILGQLVEHIKPLSISLSIDEKTARSEGLEVQERLVYGQLPEGTLSL
ncbi:MAG: hypothetical protein DWH99_12425, partial [Planctomycetota bacterium]